MNDAHPYTAADASTGDPRGSLAIGRAEPSGHCRDASAMVLRLVDRLFLRALQFVLGGVVFGIVFLPVRGRDSALDLAVAAVLLAMALAALRWRSRLLGRFRARPALALLLPLAPLLAVTLDGGFDSVWTPLVAITVGVSATLGLPVLSLGCALLTATGQAAAAWINRGDTDVARLVETAVFSAAGTVAAGIGLALPVAVASGFLHRRPQILADLRVRDLLLVAGPRTGGDEPVRRELPRAPRTALSRAELQVVTLLAAGRAPKQIAADLSVKIATVRSHLKVAKRKTHARTLAELVGLFVVEEGRL